MNGNTTPVADFNILLLMKLSSLPNFQRLQDEWQHPMRKIQWRERKHRKPLCVHPYKSHSIRR